ncbi:MAG: hypothetical protein C4583_04940 [Anaerolineaceae bacterium]|nr:MAG: hypothetical protein C4583_04940 [Anaerolineaceae bacterium]
MNRRLHDAVLQASETRAFLVLMVVLSLRARNTIASLRPAQMLLPITLLQNIVLGLAALSRQHFVSIFAIGNFIIVWLAILPSMFLPRPIRAHWVTGNENL